MDHSIWSDFKSFLKIVASQKRVGNVWNGDNGDIGDGRRMHIGDGGDKRLNQLAPQESATPNATGS